MDNEIIPGQNPNGRKNVLHTVHQNYLQTKYTISILNGNTTQNTTNSTVTSHMLWNNNTLASIGTKYKEVKST